MHSQILIFVNEENASTFEEISELELHEVKPNYVDYIEETKAEPDYLEDISKEFSKDDLMSFKGKTLTIHNPKGLFKFINKQAIERIKQILANEKFSNEILSYKNLIEEAIGTDEGGYLVYDKDDSCFYKLKTWLYWWCKHDDKPLKLNLVQVFDYHWQKKRNY